MRCARIKKERGTAVYHCISRAVAGAFLLDDEAKGMFRKMLWEVAEFSGVEVLAYCVMTNHFHLLLRVPERDAEVLTRAEVLRRYAVLYQHSNTPGYPDASYLRTIFAGDYEPLIEDWMARLTARMNDVSECLKTLKQRFTMWFNKRHKRFGTLWSERFKSVLVQDNADVVRTVAAYIDLNPVRAGLVEDPVTYAWCSYGEAMNGAERAQNGLVRGLRGRDWASTAESYRNTLFRKGAMRKGKRIGPGGAEIEGERSSGLVGGEIGESREADSGADVLRERCRAFTEGKVLGSEAFVNEIRATQEGATEAGGESFPEAVAPSKMTKANSARAERRLASIVFAEGFRCFSWLRETRFGG